MKIYNLKAIIISLYILVINVYAFSSTIITNEDVLSAFRLVVKFKRENIFAISFRQGLAILWWETSSLIENIKIVHSMTSDDYFYDNAYAESFLRR